MPYGVNSGEEARSKGCWHTWQRAVTHVAIAWAHGLLGGEPISLYCPGSPCQKGVLYHKWREHHLVVETDCRPLERIRPDERTRATLFDFVNLPTRTPHARTVHKSYVVTNGQDYRLRTSCNMPLVLQALSGVAPNASTETCDVSDFIHSNTWLLRNTGHARHVRTAQACACTLEQGAWNEQLACALVEPDLRLGTYSVHSGSLSTVRVRPM